MVSEFILNDGLSDVCGGLDDDEGVVAFDRLCLDDYEGVRSSIWLVKCDFLSDEENEE